MPKTKLYKRTRNYFVFKLGFTEQSFKKVMNEFCDQKNIITGLDDAAAIIQKDWNAFMKWWGENKSKYDPNYYENKHFSSTKKYGNKNSLRNEWAEIKEALKYTNGCADDF